MTKVTILPAIMPAKMEIHQGATRASLTRVMSAAAVTAATLTTTYATPSKAMSIGAYAVANHSNCGAGSIPGTITELDKFFASPDLPSDFVKNFYWKDARVKQSDWVSAGDYASSSETTSGYDGSDSSLLTYIASHGVTSGGIYKALSGSPSNGGCYIPTSSLSLGDNVSRYTILSTCQGLKIGTGDSPTSTGENPSRTWKTAAKGLNCILGYSNNMADADQYGTYLLANMKTGTSALSKAFMDASESVSTSNIPAVLCFGSTEADAANYIATNPGFEAESRENGASAWVYRKVSPIGKTSFLSKSIPAALQITPKALNVSRIAGTFLGTTMEQSKSKGVTNYSSPSGEVHYNSKIGVLTIKNNLIDDIRSLDVPSFSDSEAIARNALVVSGFQKIAGNLTLAATSEDVLGGIQGIKKITSRKFSFKQPLAGALSLSQQGSIEVSVGAGGVIESIVAALVDVNPSFKSTTRPTSLQDRLADLEDTAIENVADRAPGANYKVISTRVGYDVGNFHQLNRVAPAVVEITVEAAQGEFVRNFVEKIAL
jgi:Family of unknown function (DUF6345)